MEAGKLDIENIDFDLYQVLGELAKAMALLELILDLTNIHNSIVRGDPHRLRQIFTNLIANAIKFTEKGEIIIKGSLHHIGENIIFTGEVEDTGIGIPKDKILSLFDSFTQVDATITRKYGGSGLGLSIVKKLSQLMGGNVTVESELGEGSNFKFHLLFQSPCPESSSFFPTNLQGIIILLVESHHLTRQIIQRQLEKWNAKVIIAENGYQGLQHLSTNSRINLALIAHRLYDMSAMDFGKKLSKSHPDIKIPLLSMTAIKEYSKLQTNQDTIFSGCITKPFTPADLYTIIKFTSTKPETVVATDKVKENQSLTPEKIEILLVEDNKVNQLVFKGLCKKMRLKVDIANNGIEALTALQNKHYNIVFMDCLMPEMDGYTATKEIRQGKAGKENINIKIVAMTANAMEGDREKCLAVGMDDYLAKPINPDVFQQILNHHQGLKPPLEAVGIAHPSYSFV